MGAIIRSAVAALSLCAAVGQQTAPLPKFKDVSIAPANSRITAGTDRVPTSISAGLSGRLNIRNARLKDCIAWAYNVPGYLIFESGQLFPDRYDIDAKTPVGISAKKYREMLQSLLADRFDLKIHREVRDTPAYALNIANTGLKLRQVTGGRLRFRSSPKSLSGENVTMKDLAGQLSALLTKPVLDRTGTSGTFSFAIAWPQQELTSRATLGRIDGPVNGSAESFLAALRNIGLELVEEETSIEMLVVDHAVALR